MKYLTLWTLLVAVLALPLIAAGQNTTPRRMVLVEGGTYTPFYEGASGETVPVLL